MIAAPHTVRVVVTLDVVSRPWWATEGVTLSRMISTARTFPSLLEVPTECARVCDRLLGLARGTLRGRPMLIDVVSWHDHPAPGQKDVRFTAPQAVNTTTSNPRGTAPQGSERGDV